MKQILKHKKDWTRRMDLSNEDYKIQQWLDKLDDQVRGYEAKWGVGRLEKLVGQELAGKFNRQKEKLNEAIKASDLMGVEELVPGTIRGYEALDAEARSKGHEPTGTGEAWTVGMPNGKTLAICATLKDALLVQGRANPDNELVVWTLEEVANLISSHNLLTVLKRKEKVQASSGKTPINWREGDEIPW